jgi:uncharacterized protein (TIGR04255 family)
MPLSFPIIDEAEEIRLAKPPLREVVCQVRFPLILAITQTMPTQLQDRIRERYPTFDIEPAQLQKQEVLSEGTPLQVKPPVYRFGSIDDKRTVSLSTDFFALSTDQYTHWADFADELAYVSEAIHEVYTIPYGSRIGLRYINFIDQTFVEDDRFEGIYALLRPELTAMLCSDVVTMPVFAISQIRAEDGEHYLTMRYGVAPSSETSQYGFVLDFDRYGQGRLPLDDLIGRCEQYHRTIYSAFRWCIQEGKLSAFEPIS